jgi:hypothetical protein
MAEKDSWHKSKCKKFRESAQDNFMRWAFGAGSFRRRMATPAAVVLDTEMR